MNRERELDKGQRQEQDKSPDEKRLLANVSTKCID